MIPVVVGEKLGGFAPLPLRIEGAARQLRHIDFGARDVPINLFDGDIVGEPGLSPAIESHHDGFIGVIRVAWSEGFEAVQGVQVAQRPWDQGSEGGDEQNNSGAQDGKRAE